MLCFDCLKEIEDARVCKHCGQVMYPTVEEALENIRRIEAKAGSNCKGNKIGYSDEEILALGLYPKDETYKMSLISQIL